MFRKVFVSFDCGLSRLRLRSSSSKLNKMVANEAIIISLKDVLTHLLNSENKNLRRKGLEFAMEWLADIEMDFTKAEKALKFEVSGKPEEADKLVEKILDDLDKVEYEEE